MLVSSAGPLVNSLLLGCELKQLFWKRVSYFKEIKHAHDTRPGSSSPKCFLQMSESLCSHNKLAYQYIAVFIRKQKQT
jgi:hypothetical protein